MALRQTNAQPDPAGAACTDTSGRTDTPADTGVPWHGRGMALEGAETANVDAGSNSYATAMPQTPQRETGAALATAADYRSLWPPLVAVSGAVAHMVACQYDATWYALARWRLQRRARRQVARGECSDIARWIANGDWAKLDQLCDGWVQS